MRKSQKKELQFKGVITAYVSLIFILMLSLIGALLESVSIQKTKDIRRAETALALESIFAEYHPELLDQYDVFARVGCSQEELQMRLEYYGAKHMTHAVKNLRLLTDGNGASFYEQAVTHVKQYLGFEYTPGEGAGLDMSTGTEDMNRQEERIADQIEELLQQQGEELPDKDNPIAAVKRLKKTGLLSLVAPKETALSNRNVETSLLPTRRDLQKGNDRSTVSDGLDEKAFFVWYLTEHFTDFHTGKDSHALYYEQEYLLEGKESDQANLEAVCKKILGLRMATNYLYLQTDSAKKAEAEAMALTLCSLLTVPGITELVKQGILLAWAYGESIVDIRVLLKQQKVALVKSADSWQLQLSNLAKLGTAQEVSGEKESSNGLSYSDYLKGFLYIEDRETLCMRSLDLIESNLHIKTDQCMTKVEISTDSKLRRGIEDRFTSVFAYQ